MPEGVDFAAVFPITPPAFKTMASIGSFISSTAFLTEFASVTSPITIAKTFFPVFSSRSFFAASALARFLQKSITFFVSFFNANCRAVSFPSPAFAPVINILSFIFSILFRLLITYGHAGGWRARPRREGGLDAGRRVQLQRAEDLFLGFSRELSGRFAHLSQAASGDDDLVP